MSSKYVFDIMTALLKYFDLSQNLLQFHPKIATLEFLANI